MPKRTPGQPLANAKAEAYAQLRAGGMPAREAGEELGLRESGTYMRFERSPEHRARVAELKAQEEAPLKLSPEWLAGELHTNVVSARSAGQFKASTEALVRLADLYRDYKDLFDGLHPDAKAPTPGAPDPRSTDRRARLTAVPSAKESA